MDGRTLEDGFLVLATPRRLLQRSSGSRSAKWRVTGLIGGSQLRVAAELSVASLAPSTAAATDRACSMSSALTP
jgi:hypothetical protein